MKKNVTFISRILKLKTVMMNTKEFHFQRDILWKGNIIFTIADELCWKILF